MVVKAKIVERADVDVLGFGARINPTEADYSEIWASGFGPIQENVEALAVEPGYYGVYYGTDNENLVDFVAGVAVGDLDTVPDGATCRRVPGGTYAAFECKMATIGATWEAIYGKWLPTSGYDEDPARPGIERFPPRGDGPDAPVTVMVAIKPK